MMRPLFLFLMLLASVQALNAQRILDKNGAIGKALFKDKEDGTFQLRDIFRNGAAMEAENPRLVAIALNITLGLFGVHRMYLGTELLVPIAYTFTLGGGCVLWIVDLVMLIVTKDIEPFLDNPNMFMWTKAKDTPN